MSFAAILSGAWWVQRLSSVGAQALAIAAVVTVILGAIGGGLLWLRADARHDEAQQWELRLSKARQAAELVAALRLAEQQRQAAGELAAELARRQAAEARLEELVASIPKPGRCYSPELLERLNR